jgi:hypothetical protein
MYRVIVKVSAGVCSESNRAEQVLIKNIQLIIVKANQRNAQCLKDLIRASLIHATQCTKNILFIEREIERRLKERYIFNV